VIAARRSRLFFAAAVALFASLVVAVHVVRLPEPLGIDQGLFACFARWVPRGWLPYRDLFDSKPPLFLYWWACSALVPGDVVRAAWWWEGIWLALTLVAAYAVGARVGGRAVGLGAAVLLFVGLWSPAWGGFWSRAQAEEALALPMLGSAWLAWRALDRAPLAFACGVLVGVCGLFKIPSMAIALSWAVTWVACVPARDALARALRMIAGVLVPWALAFAWFAAHHAAGSFVEGVFVYQRYNAAFIAPPWGFVLQRFGGTMLSDATLLVAAGAIGVVRLARRRAREAHWLASWIVATMAAIVLQRQMSAGYHYLLVVPALAVAGGYGVAELVAALRDSEARALGGAGLVALAILALPEARSWWHAYAPDAACLTGRLSRDAYLRAIQPGGFSMVDEEEAARWLRDRTAPSDGILVWALSPGVYALADRHPVTRYAFHKILMTDAPLSRMWPGLDRRRARLMEGLRADPPKYVLVGRGDANGFEPLDSFTSMRRFRALRFFLEQRYESDASIGHFLVYRRVDFTAPAAAPASAQPPAPDSINSTRVAPSARAP